jgi:hypothetical protein
MHGLGVFKNTPIANSRGKFHINRVHGIKHRAHPNLGENAASCAQGASA